MTLPDVSLTIVSACRIGTPLLTNVPNVRQKREMATLLKTGPSTGILSLTLSTTCRPLLVRDQKMYAITAATSIPSVTTVWSLIMLLTPRTNSVNAGNDLPGNMSLKINSNLGTTTIMRTARMPTATHMTATG